MTARTVARLVHRHFGEQWPLREDGPDGGAPVAAAAWGRAQRLVVQLHLRAESMRGTLPLPLLGPVGDGSIDLWWCSPMADLVVNVCTETGSYFGQRRGSGGPAVEGWCLDDAAIARGLAALGFNGVDRW
jgi:hypothetical protein